MKKYNVHYMGYYGYDVVVEAENEEEARDIADGYEPEECEYYYEAETPDIWEADEDDEVTYSPSK